MDRVVQITDRLALTIREHSGAVHESTGKSLTGGWIWDSALVLARCLAQTSSSSSPSICSRKWADVAGKRVVELGAGMGVPGLAAAALGAREVVLTDRRELLDWLKANVEANQLGSSVSVKELEWGNSSDARMLRPVDLVLCSDVMYDPEAMPLLGRTLLDLLGEGTVAIVAYEVRLGTMECIAALQSFCSELVWQEEPVHDAEQVGLLLLKRLEPNPDV